MGARALRKLKIMEREIIGGKSTDRIPKSYKKGTPDWDRQFNMLLPDGEVCMWCVHAQRCATMFGQNIHSKTCQFYPSKWQPKETCKHCGSVLDDDGDCYKCLMEFDNSMCR